MGYRLIFWYLFRQHLGLALLVLVGLFGIVLLGQFADMSRYQSEAQGWSALDTLKLSLYRTPVLMQAILPHALLISTALTVARASRRLEVTILMQNGLSQFRILTPVALAAAVIGGAYTLVVNPISAQTFSASQRALDGVVASQSEPDRRQPREMVLRDEAGANYLMIDHVTQGAETLLGVRVYRVDTAHTLRHAVEAERAVAVEGGWRLEETQELYRAPDLGAAGELPAILRLSAQALTERYDNETTASFFALPDKIALARIVGAPVHELRLQLLWLAGLPVLLGAIALLSGAIVIRPMQRGGWKADAALVLAAAFVIYTLSTVLDALGTRAVIAPSLAVGVIPALALAAAVFTMWLKRGVPARRARRVTSLASPALPARQG